MSTVDGLGERAPLLDGARSPIDVCNAAFTRRGADRAQAIFDLAHAIHTGGITPDEIMHAFQGQGAVLHREFSVMDFFVEVFSMYAQCREHQDAEGHMTGIGTRYSASAMRYLDLICKMSQGGYITRQAFQNVLDNIKPKYGGEVAAAVKADFGGEVLRARGIFSLAGVADAFRATRGNIGVFNKGATPIARELADRSPSPLAVPAALSAAAPAASPLVADALGEEAALSGDEGSLPRAGSAKSGGEAMDPLDAVPLSQVRSTRALDFAMGHAAAASAAVRTPPRSPASGDGSDGSAGSGVLVDGDEARRLEAEALAVPSSAGAEPHSAPRTLVLDGSGSDSESDAAPAAAEASVAASAAPAAPPTAVSLLAPHIDAVVARADEIGMAPQTIQRWLGNDGIASDVIALAGARGDYVNAAVQLFSAAKDLMAAARAENAIRQRAGEPLIATNKPGLMASILLERHAASDVDARDYLTNIDRSRGDRVRAWVYAGPMARTQVAAAAAAAVASRGPASAVSRMAATAVPSPAARASAMDGSSSGSEAESSSGEETDGELDGEAEAFRREHLLRHGLGQLRAGAAGAGRLAADDVAAARGRFAARGGYGSDGELAARRRDAARAERGYTSDGAMSAASAPAGRPNKRADFQLDDLDHEVETMMKAPDTLADINHWLTDFKKCDAKVILKVMAWAAIIFTAGLAYLGAMLVAAGIDAYKRRHIEDVTSMRDAPAGDAFEGIPYHALPSDGEEL